MCGRYGLIDTTSFRSRFGTQNELEGLGPRYNAAPGQQLPVVLGREERQLALMRWGLVPSWADDPRIGNRMINARAETLSQKPSFSRPLRSQRCLVPASGFYEWAKADGRKVPYFIRRKDGELFAFAGLWDSWRDPGSREELNTYTIITTRSNDLVAPIHNRMPAILLPQHEELWLDPDLTRPEVLLPLLGPYPETEMEAYPVSTAVNRPGVDTADLVRPEVNSA